MAAMEQLVRRSAALHLAHIADGGDPFELGSSRPLDFGHWAAHKLEQLTSHRLRHGEAVAIGIALDSTYAHLSGLLAEPDWRRIIDVLERSGLPIYAPELPAIDDRRSAGVLRGPRGVPRASRRPADGHAAARHRQAVRRARDRPDVMMRSIELVARARATRGRQHRRTPEPDRQPTPQR